MGRVRQHPKGNQAIPNLRFQIQSKPAGKVKTQHARPEAGG